MIIFSWIANGCLWRNSGIVVKVEMAISPSWVAIEEIKIVKKELLKAGTPGGYVNLVLLF